MEQGNGAAARNGRIYSVQALRGIAAGLVVVAHGIEHAPGHGGNTALLTGRFGVDIFFVISGFIILHVAGDDRFQPGDFIAKRIWRVAPLYWALTLVVAATALLVPATFRTTTFDLGYLFNSLAFIPSPLPGTNDYRPLFKLGWTLNYEMFFYALTAVLFWCGSRERRALVLVAVLAVLAAGSLFVERKTFAGFYLSLNVLPFALGAVLAVAWHRGGFDRLGGIARAAIVAVAAAMVIWFYGVPFASTKEGGGHLIMTGAACAVVAAGLALERAASRFDAAGWLGDISYSLYLTHMFVIGAAWAVLKRLDVTPFTLVGALGIAAMVGASLVAAHLVYTYFERPLLKVRFGSRVRPARS